jgi:hypothetical protein
VLTGRGIQGTEAEVAVGLEGAYTEFLGQGEGLAVVRRGRRGLRGIGVGVDNAKLAQCVRLGPAPLSQRLTSRPQPTVRR